MTERDQIYTGSRHILSHAVDIAFALHEQLEVIHETAFNAVNEGTANPEEVLERIKHLSLLAIVAAAELEIDLGERITIKAYQAVTVAGRASRGGK